MTEPNRLVKVLIFVLFISLIVWAGTKDIDKEDRKIKGQVGIDCALVITQESEICR